MDVSTGLKAGSPAHKPGIKQKPPVPFIRHKRPHYLRSASHIHFWFTVGKKKYNVKGK